LGTPEKKRKKKVRKIIYLKRKRNLWGKTAKKGIYSQTAIEESILSFADHGK
jgi:hypothetical protein